MADEIHVSGAEGLFQRSLLLKAAGEFVDRALTHSRGRADRIIVTIEEIGSRPKLISSLPVTTLQCESPEEAEGFVRSLLGAAGVSRRAVSSGLRVMRAAQPMRGAAIIRADSGKRAEGDRRRGIRASRLGIGGTAAKTLSRVLAPNGIDTTTVIEALTLASKVASCGGVVAELCISDDPDYTTGYVSCGRFGYVRIPYMKKWGAKSGGRVFFVSEKADVDAVAEFLESTPVMINRIAECRGSCSIDEVLDNPDR